MKYLLRIILISLLLFLVVYAEQVPLFAQENKLEPASFTVWGILLPSGYFGIGGGIRGNWYINKKGIAEGVADDLEFDFGADISIHFVSDWTYSLLTIPVGVLWRFKLTDNLWLYPKLAIGYEFTISKSPYHSDYVLGGIYWEGAIGGFLKINKRVVIRVEAGYPGLKAGIAFPLH